MFASTIGEADRWFPEDVYASLRSLSASMLRDERPGHTLQPTALANEAFLRLSAQRTLAEAPRERLLALAAIMIRRILVDHYRKKSAVRRGGDRSSITRVDADRFSDPHASTADPSTILAVEEAIRKLESLDRSKADLVIQRFYGGMTIAEIASLRGDSTRCVERQWAFARAWLGRELSP